MTGLPRRTLLSLLSLLSATDMVRAAGESVVIVSSERGGAYQEVAEALMLELERGGVPRQEMLHLALPEYESMPTVGPRLYVTLGTGAAAALARRETRVPVLCALLPSLAFERIGRETGRRPSARFSALFLAQPPERQLDLIRLALPRVRRVGVLWADESQPLLAPLEQAARARGLHIVAEQVGVGEPVFGPLKRVLDDADVLLALPDPNLYNSNSIQNIMLASYRARVPMMAYSAGFSRAGALLALYSSPGQIGRQAARMARAVLQERGALPSPQGPQEFTLSVNVHVARSLGLSLDEAELTERLRRLVEKGS